MRRRVSRGRILPGSIFFGGDGCDESLERFVAIGALRACGCFKDLDAARHVHSRGMDRFPGDILASNTLISVYARCGGMDDARSVFQAMAARNIVSWNALIGGYADSDRPDLALEYYSTMIDSSGFEPDARSILAAIKACKACWITAAGENDQEVRHRGRVRRERFGGFLREVWRNGSSQ